MAPTISIATHNTSTKIGDEPLPWYLVTTFIDPKIGEIIHYKDLIKPKEE